MLDISSTPRSSTCTNTSSTNSYLKSILNNNSSATRGTTYYYPQKLVVSLFAQALTELGFNATAVNSDNYNNHITLNDYSDKVHLQIYNSGSASTYFSMLYPRHTASTVSLCTMNSGTTCYSTLRMVGQGPGKTNTVLYINTTSAPALNTSRLIYFTDAKCLMTGEMHKAVIFQSGYSYYAYLYDNEWNFLPGYDSESTTPISFDGYSMNLTYNSNYSYIHDPYISYKIFEEQTNFPEIPVVTNDGLWEFPGIIQNPYGYYNNTNGSLKYTLTAGTIYQIGDKKYLCIDPSVSYYLLRVE